MGDPKQVGEQVKGVGSGRFTKTRHLITKKMEEKSYVY